MEQLRSVPASTMQRVLEMCVGVMLSVVTLVALGVFLDGLGRFFFGPVSSPDHPLWLLVVVTLASGAITWWGARTCWHFFTGLERPGGGLLSPLVLVITGIVFILFAVFMLVRFGYPGAIRAVQFVLGGVGLIGLARVRSRKQASRGAA